MKKIIEYFKNFIQKIKKSDFYNTYKEEMIFVPLLLIGFFLINHLLITFFPNSAFFDYFSEIESIIFKVVSFAVALWIAHFSLRISFPNVYKFLHEDFYHNFDSISKDKKTEYVVKFILTFILASALIFGARATNTSDEKRDILLNNIHSQLDVRETKPNRGPMVDIYLKSVKSTPGNPWCAAFVGYNLTYIDVKNPNTAWSPDYAKTKDVIWKSKKKTNVKLLPGDVVTYYYPNLGRVGHVGILVKIDNSGYFITIEGNTNGSGSREGDGVYKKKRSPNKVYAVSRYIL